MSPTIDPLDDICYLIPEEKFIYRLAGRWQVETPVTAKGIVPYLTTRGMDPDIARAAVKGGTFRSVLTTGIVPNAPAIAATSDGLVANLWVPPTIQPQAGEWPTIERTIMWLVAGDEEAAQWLVQWIALKVQNPDVVPKVAVVLQTTPGAGKGTLYRIISEILGPDNCAAIDLGALESRFNRRWIQKLFVFADEVTNSANRVDISQKLKVLVDSTTLELESKGANQREVQNRAAWMFASNDPIAPLRLERGDRRYSVFSNFEDITVDYKALLDGCFETDRRTYTKAFAAEIQAFYADLLSLQVDRNLVFRPYLSKARDALIRTNAPSYESFFIHVEEHGVEEIVSTVLRRTDWMTPKAEWDFGRAIATDMIYACYRKYCDDRKMGVLSKNHFCKVLNALRPQWPRTRCSVGERQVYAYALPRKPGAPVLMPVTNEVTNETTG